MHIQRERERTSPLSAIALMTSSDLNSISAATIIQSAVPNPNAIECEQYMPESNCAILALPGCGDRRRCLGQASVICNGRGARLALEPTFTSDTVVVPHTAPFIS